MAEKRYIAICPICESIMWTLEGELAYVKPMGLIMGHLRGHGWSLEEIIEVLFVQAEDEE